MGHVNNATYLDVLDGALAADADALAGPRPPVRYQVEYLRPALPRAQVSVVRGAHGAAAAFRFLDTDSQELVRALVAAGWERTGPGGAWYAQRFIWRGSGEPRPVVVADDVESAQ